MKKIKNTSIIEGQKKGLLIAALLVAQFGFSQNQPDPNYKGVIGKTLAESKEYWPDPVKPPKGSPNVVWIILDDVGYGATSAFGGHVSNTAKQCIFVVYENLAF